MIRLEKAVKRFGPIEAVKDLSFELEPGRVVGFLGPNGAGKTTAMRLISGYLQPDAGKVWALGMDMAEQGVNLRRRLGYLPENNPLYPDMTPLEYLEMTGRLRGLKQRGLRQAVAAMVDACHLGTALKKPIGSLSKGYRQRVGLAQAMIHDPELLILDEPTTGLDPNQLAEMKRLILELGRSKTLLLSTHILQHVPELCDRVLILSRGSLVYDGPPGTSGARLTVDQTLEPIRKWADQLGFPVQTTELEGYDRQRRYRLLGDWNADRMAQAFESLRAKPWRIVEWATDDTSLEDLFRERTTEADP